MSNTVSLPPQNVDVEEAILGGILLDPDAIARVIDILPVEAFFTYAHQEIYKACVKLHEKNQPTDLMNVVTYLLDHNRLELVGGQQFLVHLVDRTVSALNIDRYAHLVVEKYRRRQSIQLGNELVEVSHDLATPLDGSLELIEDKLYRIKDGRLDNRYQLEDALQMTAPLWDAIEQGKNAGKSIGWSDLDFLTGGLHNKTITIIGADSHMGKTSFMVGMAYQVLTELSEPVLFFSCEMSKEQLNPRILSRVTGLNSSRLTKGNQPGGVEPHEWEKIAQGIQTFSALPWMVYDEPSPSMSTIRSIIKQAIRRHGKLGAVFLDYIQMLSLGGHNRVQELGEITRILRAIAKDFDFPFFVGSQINREASKRKGKDMRPTKNDLRDSGEIGEAADLVVMLFRPGHYAKNPADKTIEVIVDKNRPYGCLGTAKMLVDLETCNFMQLDNRYTSTVEEDEENW